MCVPEDKTILIIYKVIELLIIVRGPAGWPSGLKHLPSNLLTWVWSRRFTWCKEKTHSNKCSLTSTYTLVCVCWHIHRHMCRYVHMGMNKCAFLIWWSICRYMYIICLHYLIVYYIWLIYIHKYYINQYFYSFQATIGSNGFYHGISINMNHHILFSWDSLLYNLPVPSALFSLFLFLLQIIPFSTWLSFVFHFPHLPFFVKLLPPHS